MSQALKNITARLALTAAYEGTKVGDLMKYLKGLVPGIRVIEGIGPAGRDPGKKNAVLTMEQAHALGNKLIADGWFGRKIKLKIKPTADQMSKSWRDGTPTPEVREQEFVYYVPSMSGGKEFTLMNTPFIKLMRPKTGDNRVRMEFGQSTHASVRERKFLSNLRRTAPRGSSGMAPRGISRYGD